MNTESRQRGFLLAEICIGLLLFTLLVGMVGPSGFSLLSHLPRLGGYLELQRSFRYSCNQLEAVVGRQVRRVRIQTHWANQQQQLDCEALTAQKQYQFYVKSGVLYRLTVTQVPGRQAEQGYNNISLPGVEIQALAAHRVAPQVFQLQLDLRHTKSGSRATFTKEFWVCNGIVEEN